jgi:hypothetical protein
MAKDIEIHPEKVKRYGTLAQTHFDKLRSDLQIITNVVDRAPYEGDNAAYFKNTCGDMVGEFSAKFLEDMQEISELVRVTTSNIAQALGGQPIVIKVNGSKIVPQKVSANSDGSQKVDTIALASLPKIMNTRFEHIRSELKGHQRDFTNFDVIGWRSKAKTSADGAINTFTTNASRHATEAETEIVKFIQSQLDALQAADK